MAKHQITNKDMENKRYLVGSTYFFSGIDGFKGKDTDWVEIISPQQAKREKINVVRQISFGGVCLFIFVKKPKEELIQYALTHKPYMQINKFLVKEVAEELGFDPQDLKRFEPLFEKLDDKHKYFVPLIEGIVKNNSFVIDEETRARAYEVYCEYRKPKEKKNEREQREAENE